MAGRMPLHAVWMLSGETVKGDAAPAFTLPGADALAQFADLLGDTAEAPPQEAEPAPKGVPFPLPALLPDDVAGEAELSCTLDFGALCADRAHLHFEHITGSGEALLDGQPLAHFTTGPLELDLTDALSLSKKQTLTLRFDASRPAGVPGHVLLRTSGGASIESASLSPNAKRETMTLRCVVHARRAGRYRLLAQPCMTDERGGALPIRQTHIDLREGEEKAAELSLSVPASVFASGKPYAPAAVRLLLAACKSTDTQSTEKKPGFIARLFHEKNAQLPEHLRTPVSGGTLCDSLTLMCGYPGPAAQAYVPLTEAETQLAPQELVRRAAALHIPALAVPRSVSDALARALTLEGIALVLLAPVSDADRARLARLPAVSFADSALPAGAPLEVSALRLASMVTMPRSIPADASPAELLREAAGRAMDPDAPDVHERLCWLRAVSVRLAAEAARQAQLAGPVCDPGEWNMPDIRDALRTAFAPLHLSALPLRGAWWTLSRFSASLHAFLPEDCQEPLLARAVLENEEGGILASCEFPCPPQGGNLGVFEAALPEKPCVLTLTCRLMQGETVIEESELPVYVGLRGTLEAAFS